VDELIPELGGLAHIDPEQTKLSVQSILKKYVSRFSNFNGDNVIKNRIDRWGKIGQWDMIDSTELETFHLPVSRILKPESTSQF
jgi:hypothetical protein